MTAEPLFGGTRRPTAQIINEDGAWAITLPGLPFAAEGHTLAEAISEVIQSLREYAEDWEGRLQIASNHAFNQAIVRLVEASTDAQLANWLVGGHPRTGDK